MGSFIQHFAFGGLVSLGIGSPKAKDAIYKTITNLPDIPEDKDVFFGPAMRKTPGDSKEDVLGSVALWVDVDNINKPRWTITPTYVVFSGHGWHCYWMLDVPCLNVEVIEQYNKLLAEDLDGDKGCWNANRVLRVPGTTNNKYLEEPDKYDSPVFVKITHSLEGLRYSLDEFDVLKVLPKKSRHKIATGDKRGYRSRSERDWQILEDLVASGASDALIYKIFQHQPCGDKHRESGSDLYLKHSLTRIREKAPVLPPEEATELTEALVERDDGYYARFRKGLRRVSTFILDPLILLDGSSFDIEDSLVCDVRHGEYVWKDKVFPRDAFNSVPKMTKVLPVAAWQWLGRDDDVKELLPYLLEKLKEKGLPRVAATKMMGLHCINGKWLFLGDKQVISKDDLWEGFEGPLAWMTSKVEHPSMDLNPADEKEVHNVGELIPQLNEPHVIWPMIGWYAASVLKPWIETTGYRFPILNVAGTRGSGKTTLIQRVFMPLWGQDKPTSYDSGTTKFVTLALMGSSNAIPIAFSEFRVDAVQRFLRFVLLSYDTGHDPRGRADQTTQDYPLQAPFSLDGEDLIDDAAARERIIVAKLHPQTIEEGSEYYATFKEMYNIYGGTPRMGGTLIARILALEPSWEEFLTQARDAVFGAFPNKLPDRVRNNHIIAYFGVVLWCAITETDLPSADVLERSILSVFDIKAGRSRTLSDDMVEYIVNKANGGQAMYKYTVEGGVFWFQLTPAYDDWVYSRRRQGRGTLEKDAMLTQVTEAPYYTPPQQVRGVWMYGIDLTKATDSGLDVPNQMNTREFRMSL